MKVVGADGQVGKEAKSTDLKNGAKLSCTYKFKSGPGGFGRRRFGGGGFGDGFRFFARAFDGYNSDCSY